MRWAEIYNDLCMAYGWTWAYVDEEVTLPMLREIYESWGRRPPLHWMVAAYFGIGQDGPTRTPEDQEDELAAAVAAFNGV